MLFLRRIIFFARGNADTPESACFAFTAVADGGGGGEDKTTQQQHHKFETHAFRCQVPEAVSKVFVSFAQVRILLNPERLFSRCRHRCSFSCRSLTESIFNSTVFHASKHASQYVLTT